MLTTKEIQEAICRRELNYNKFVAENVNNFLVGEADVLSLTPYGYTTEFEVKISRNDFKADAKKTKWRHYNRELEGMIDQYAMVPNYFYYVCPENLINESEIKPYQGLIYIVEGEALLIKKAKRIHSVKLNYVKTLQKLFTVTAWKHYFGAQRLSIEAKKQPEKDFTKVFTQLKRDKYCFKPCPPNQMCECLNGNN